MTTAPELHTALMEDRSLHAKMTPPAVGASSSRGGASGKMPHVTTPPKLFSLPQHSSDCDSIFSPKVDAGPCAPALPPPASPFAFWHADGAHSHALVSPVLLEGKKKGGLLSGLKKMFHHTNHAKPDGRAVTGAGQPQPSLCGAQADAGCGNAAVVSSDGVCPLNLSVSSFSSSRAERGFRAPMALRVQASSSRDLTLAALISSPVRVIGGGGAAASPGSPGATLNSPMPSMPLDTAASSYLSLADGDFSSSSAAAAPGFAIKSSGSSSSGGGSGSSGLTRPPGFSGVGGGTTQSAAQLSFGGSGSIATSLSSWQHSGNRQPWGAASQQHAQQHHLSQHPPQHLHAALLHKSYSTAPATGAGAGAGSSCGSIAGGSGNLPLSMSRCDSILLDERSRFSHCSASSDADGAGSAGGRGGTGSSGRIALPHITVSSRALQQQPPQLLQFPLQQADGSSYSYSRSPSGGVSPAGGRSGSGTPTPACTPTTACTPPPPPVPEAEVVTSWGACGWSSKGEGKDEGDGDGGDVPGSVLLGMNPAVPMAMRRRRWALEDYQVLKRMYRGSTSAVYRATCNRSGMTVALKVYFLNRVPINVIHMIRREIDLHMPLVHQNVIMLYGAFQDEKHIVLVEEFAARGDLFGIHRSMNCRLTETQTTELVLVPFLDALSYLHSRGIMHRDIKPENILFTQDWALKVADFGVSINVHAERAVTRTGTADYMAPEVERCPLKHAPEDNKNNPILAYTPAIDIWSVGVLAYEMLVGFPPFLSNGSGDDGAGGGGGVAEFLAEQATRQTLRFPASVSLAAKDFIMATLNESPGDRPTAQQLLKHPWLFKLARRPSTNSTLRLYHSHSIAAQH